MSPSKLNTDTPSVEESETTDIPPPPLPIENQTASTSHFDHLETSGIELPAPPPLPDGTGMDEIDDSFISFLEVGGEDVESSVGVRAMRAMIAAAYADGELQDEEREIIEGRLDNLPDNEAEFIRAELCDPKPVSTFAKGVVNKRDKKLIFGLAVAVLKADGKAMKGETEFARELAKTLGLSNSEAKEIIEKVS
jgi:hypothetical protein